MAYPIRYGISDRLSRKTSNLRERSWLKLWNSGETKENPWDKNLHIIFLFEIVTKSNDENLNFLAPNPKCRP